MGPLIRGMLTAVLMIASVRLAGGQVTFEPSAAPSRLGSLKAGEDIRVRCTGQYFEGRFERTTADSLFLTSSRVSIAELDTVWALRSPPVVAAGAAGALGGMVLGLFISTVESVCVMDCSTTKQGLSGTRIAQGAVIGALLGMAAVSTSRFWRPVYP